MAGNVDYNDNDKDNDDNDDDDDNKLNGIALWQFWLSLVFVVSKHLFFSHTNTYKTNLSLLVWHKYKIRKEIRNCFVLAVYKYIF